ncbi:MAG TPA: hypothetical protein V6C81_09800 [Planktothrix sp.]|jgi:hypothetical protein
MQPEEATSKSQFDLRDSTQIGETEPIFFYLAPRKLVLLSILSFGVYDLWWFFKNWLFANEKLGLKLSPGLRAIFPVIWNLPLFNLIRKVSQENGVTGRFPTVSIFVLWLCLQIICRFCDGPAFLFFVALCALPLWAVQKHINNLNKAVHPNAVPNSAFTAGNWVMIVLGAMCWISYIVGIAAPHH